MPKRAGGFTLVEILVVIIIIGILAAIAVQRFGSTKDRAYLAAMQSDLRNLVTAEAAYYADSSRFSADVSVLSFNQTTGVNTPAIVTGTGYWSATVTDVQLPGTVCAVAVSTANPLLASAGDGAPACQ